MSIKKSFLEQKWYYRIIKTLFLVLPLLVAVVLFLIRKININFIFQKDLSIILQRNINYIVYAVLGIIAYYLLIKLLWKIFFYVCFGGLEDDTKSKGGQVVQSVSSTGGSALNSKDKNELFSLISLLIVIGCIYYAYFIYKPLQPNHDVKITPGCVSTGCGNLYRCSGTYYVDGVQKRVDNCYSSSSRPSIIYNTWSGTCRQCP